MEAPVYMALLDSNYDVPELVRDSPPERSFLRSPLYLCQWGGVFRRAMFSGIAWFPKSRRWLYYDAVFSVFFQTCFDIGSLGPRAMVQRLRQVDDDKCLSTTSPRDILVRDITTSAPTSEFAFQPPNRPGQAFHRLFLGHFPISRGPLSPQPRPTRSLAGVWSEIGPTIPPALSMRHIPIDTESFAPSSSY